MPIFIPSEKIKNNQSFGQAVNKAVKEYVNPELKRRKRSDYISVGIELFMNGTHKIYIDSELQVMIEFKKKKVNPNDVGKPVNVDLHDIKDIKWSDNKLSKDSAKILIIHFNDNWWIWDADFKGIKWLEDKFRVTTTHKIRGVGRLPLHILRTQKVDAMKGWRKSLEEDLPAMWQRHVTVSQRYSGIMVYDGNYFDLFSQAQDLYILGFYYPAITVCRTAAEQALVQILMKTGKGFEIYKQERGKRKLKSIEGLIGTCRSYSLFRGKYPINKISMRKLYEIADTGSSLVHPKTDLDGLDAYKEPALKCMDNLQYVIKNHLNFVKDTGTVSGYRMVGKAKRLR